MIYPCKADEQTSTVYEISHFISSKCLFTLKIGPRSPKHDKLLGLLKDIAVQVWHQYDGSKDISFSGKFSQI